MVQRTIVVAILAAATAANAAPKTVTIAKPTVGGSLDAKAVDASLQRARGRVTACYQKLLAKDSLLVGRIVMTFSVRADGSIANAYTSGVTPELRACVSDSVGKLSFGKPKDGPPAAVAVVVTFDDGTEAFAPITPTPGPDEPVEHGEGSGVGHGIGHNNIKTPTVAIGQPNAQGDLDKAIIRRYIKRNIQKIEYCYEKTLVTTPGLAGTAQIEFVIGADGKVTSSKGSGLDKVDACVAGVIQGIEFPPPKGGGNVKVNYPFVFRPAD